MSADQRLAVYGTLVPGGENHHQLAALRGSWATGVVRGEVSRAGRYPRLTLDPAGSEVAVQVFASADLPAHWARLDAFEGPGYRRVAVEVATAAGPVTAQIYVAAC